MAGRVALARAAPQRRGRDADVDGPRRRVRRAAPRAAPPGCRCPPVVWLDAAGGVLERPYFVMDRVPGAPPRRGDDVSFELGELLARLHAVRARRGAARRTARPTSWDAGTRATASVRLSRDAAARRALRLARGARARGGRPGAAVGRRRPAQPARRTTAASPRCSTGSSPTSAIRSRTSARRSGPASACWTRTRSWPATNRSRARSTATPALVPLPGLRDPHRDAAGLQPRVGGGPVAPPLARCPRARPGGEKPAPGGGRRGGTRPRGGGRGADGARANHGGREARRGPTRPRSPPGSRGSSPPTFFPPPRTGRCGASSRSAVALLETIALQTATRHADEGVLEDEARRLEFAHDPELRARLLADLARTDELLAPLRRLFGG